LKYYCDEYRHLVCKPYSIENLHIMANELEIKRCWFHKTHYDIPKRRIEEIKLKCEVVDKREILKIIKNDWVFRICIIYYNIDCFDYNCS